MCACTGHSLGGALATLAAYDIAVAVRNSNLDAHLCVYTFGQPRVGNHTFANEYTQVDSTVLFSISNLFVHALRCNTDVFLKIVCPS